MQIFIKTLTGKTITIDVQPCDPIFSTDGLVFPSESSIEDEEIEAHLQEAEGLLSALRKSGPILGAASALRSVRVWFSSTVAYEFRAGKGLTAADLIALASCRSAQLADFGVAATATPDSCLLVRSTRRQLRPDEAIAEAVPEGDSLVLVPNAKAAALDCAAGATAKAYAAQMSAREARAAARAARMSAGMPSATAPPLPAAPSESFAVHVVLGGSYLMRVLVRSSFTVRQLRSLVKAKHARLLKPKASGLRHQGVPRVLPSNFALALNGQMLRKVVHDGKTSLSRDATLLDVGVGRGSVLIAAGCGYEDRAGAKVSLSLRRHDTPASRSHPLFDSDSDRRYITLLDHARAPHPTVVVAAKAAVAAAEAARARQGTIDRLRAAVPHTPELRITLGMPVAELRAAVAAAMNAAVEATVRRQAKADAEAERRPGSSSSSASASAGSGAIPAAAPFPFAPLQSCEVELLLAGWIAMADGARIGDYGVVESDAGGGAVTVLVTTARPLPSSRDIERYAHGDPMRLRAWGSDGGSSSSSSSASLPSSSAAAEGRDGSTSSAGAGAGAASSAAPALGGFCYEGPLRITLKPFAEGVHIELDAHTSDTVYLLCEKIRDAVFGPGSAIKIGPQTRIPFYLHLQQTPAEVAAAAAEAAAATARLASYGIDRVVEPKPKLAELDVAAAARTLGSFGLAGPAITLDAGLAELLHCRVEAPPLTAEALPAGKREAVQAVARYLARLALATRTGAYGLNAQLSQN